MEGEVFMIRRPLWHLMQNRLGSFAPQPDRIGG